MVRLDLCKGQSAAFEKRQEFPLATWAIGWGYVTTLIARFMGPTCADTVLLFVIERI